MKHSNYWIYPGVRRPVVVYAESEAEAVEKVNKSPEYDGFGGTVYRVEKFAEMCLKGEA